MWRSLQLTRHPSQRFNRWILPLFLLGAWLRLEAAPAAVDYLKDVRPILAGHCFKCHGPDAEKRKADLRLDEREAALKPAKSGEPAVVPGKPDASELVKRILTADEDDLMPPPATKHPLTQGQKDLLSRWIAEGADYKPHWAFVKPVEPPFPEVAKADWPQNGIDRFVLAELERRGLKPQDKADPYTLVRRVYLDLIGLPPTPTEADAFVNDSSPDAWERVVDRLLASPHYGERWARRWLDLARYADTNGYEKDRPRSIWPYRDWVIRAINSGMPFDQFTVEQLAGDLLPNATLDQHVATGFHRNSMINEEGGTDPQEFRFHAMVDRMHVTSTTWLGLTMACVQCHTHKYDPIQHKEYYQMMAFLNNADEPWIDVPTREVSEQRDRQRARIDPLRTELVAQFPTELRADWITPAVARFNSETGRAAERLSDGSWLVEAKGADKDIYTITLDAGPGPYHHLQLAALPDRSLPQNGPGGSEAGNFVLSEIEVRAAAIDAADNPVKVPLARARADFSQDGFGAWTVLDQKDNTGWAIDGGGNWHVTRTLTVHFDKPVTFEQGTRFVIRLTQHHGKNHVLGRFRLSLGRDLTEERPIQARRDEHLQARTQRWIERELPRIVAWTPLQPVAVQGSYPTLTLESNATVFVSGDFTKSDSYTLDYQGDWKGVTALRLEVLPDDRLPNRGPGRVNYEGPFGDFFLSDVKVFQGAEPAGIKSASDSFRSGGNDAAKAIDEDLQSGWSINGGQGRSHNAVFVFDRPLDTSGPLRLKMIFEKYYAAGLGKFRLWTTREPAPVAVPHPNPVQDALLALKNDPDDAAKGAALKILREHYVTLAPELEEERSLIAQLERDLPAYPTTLVMTERAPDHPRPTRIHKRGEFLQPTEEVQAGLPAILPGLPPGEPRNRLGFARWLVSPENPLTARVVMNREWQGFFGRGLVRTMEDFGLQGELPSHPQLLDWLAIEFVRRSWSVKAMHKLVVMSATYQQASHLTADRLEQDPENVWLSRGPRFRMEAEMVRDNMLRASGSLASKLGGPSVFPPQLASVTTEGAYGPLRWTVSEGEDRYRRSLYTFAKRTAPFALFNAFDAPSGEACVARRDRSNTPLQALTLLNDGMFLELARTLGASLAGASGSVEDKIREVFRRFLTRPPSAGELAKLRSFYQRQLARFAAGDLKAAEFLAEDGGSQPGMHERAAWTALARVLMNLDEAVTKS